MVQYRQNHLKERNINVSTTDEYRNGIENKFKAVCFLKRANNKKYGNKLLNSLREQHLFKIYIHSQMLVEANKLLLSHTHTKGKHENVNRKTVKENSEKTGETTVQQYVQTSDTRYNVQNIQCTELYEGRNSEEEQHMQMDDGDDSDDESKMLHFLWT